MYCDGFDEIFMINKRNDGPLYRDPYLGKAHLPKKEITAKLLPSVGRKTKTRKLIDKKI